MIDDSSYAKSGYYNIDYCRMYKLVFLFVEICLEKIVLGPRMSWARLVESALVHSFGLGGFSYTEKDKLWILKKFQKLFEQKEIVYLLKTRNNKLKQSYPKILFNNIY